MLKKGKDDEEYEKCLMLASVATDTPEDSIVGFAIVVITDREIRVTGSCSHNEHVRSMLRIGHNAMIEEMTQTSAMN